jgi:hypothetical protein
MQMTDNILEDYFLELVINKHAIDREIRETLDIIDASNLHEDYKILVKKTLFWEKNLFLENWGTLGTSLMDMIHTEDIRGHEVDIYGIVLGVMLRVIEEVFNVDNEHFHDFLLSESREDIEHRLIILIKRVLDFIERGLGEMFENIENLDGPIVNGHVRKEFDIIKSSLLQYSGLILESEGSHIRELKIQVDALVIKIEEKKKHLKRK